MAEPASAAGVAAPSDLDEVIASAYYKLLRKVELPDTADHRKLSNEAWEEGARWALVRSTQLAGVIPLIRLFVDLLDVEDDDGPDHED